MPERLRKKSFGDTEWKKNPNAIKVVRGTIYGNPFKIKDEGRKNALIKYCHYLKSVIKGHPSFLEEIRGKDLVCWCKLEQPCCHAEILLKLANLKEGEDWQNILQV